MTVNIKDLLKSILDSYGHRDKYSESRMAVGKISVEESGRSDIRIEYSSTNGELSFIRGPDLKRLIIGHLR